MDDGNVSDRPRKLMPSITTYTSDDSLEEDDLSGSQDSDTKSSVQKPASCEPVQQTEAGSPESSPGSSNSDDEGAFASLAEKLAALPITELIASREFIRARKRIFRNRKHRSKSLTQSFALFFDETKAKVKEQHPDANFGQLVRLITDRWDALTDEEKKEYQKRGVASVQQGDTQSLLSYKTRLLSLNPGKQRLCCNPSCSQPVVLDPRWNGQYCSAACVSEHCRMVFMNWFDKRVGPTTPSPGADLPVENVKPRTESPKPVEAMSISTPVVKLEPITSTPCSLHLIPNQREVKPEPTSPTTNRNAIPSIEPICTKPEAPDASTGIAQRKSLFESLQSPEFSLISVKPFLGSATTR